jgi:hypothetical protein
MSGAGEQSGPGGNRPAEKNKVKIVLRPEEAETRLFSWLVSDTTRLEGRHRPDQQRQQPWHPLTAPQQRL